MMENGSTAGSLLLIALGAILAWAVEYQVAGIDIKVIGAILLIVGTIGLVLSLLFWASFAPFRSNRRAVIVQHEEPRRP
ncbi:MAG: DUF6458 family protein [Chloroflexota bacterium]